MEDGASYCVYLLTSEVAPGRTYVGCTNRPLRRLRQHNGELSGGAKYTASHRPWRRAALIRGFRCRAEALQFEWSWKAMPPKRLGGPAARLQKLAALLRRERWTSRAPPARDVPLLVALTSAFPTLERLPSYVAATRLEADDALLRSV